MAWLCLYAAIVMDGASISSFMKLSPAILVFGGTFGATMIGFSMKEVKELPKKVKTAFSMKKYDYEGVITKMVQFAIISRRDGVLALENEIEKLDDEFMKKGLQMAVDGVDLERVRDTLETDIHSLTKWYKSGEEFLKQLGGFSPTLGIIGTVLGLIMMLSELENAESMGPAIASAFIATMYGVSAANLLYLPLGNKIKTVAAEDVLEKRIILEGLAGIQAGISPRMIEQSLISYLYPEKVHIKTDKGGAGAAKAA
jgi:chemotaxis protein MotA